MKPAGQVPQRCPSVDDVAYEHEDVAGLNAFAKIDSIMLSYLQDDHETRRLEGGGSTSRARAAGAGAPSTPPGGGASLRHLVMMAARPSIYQTHQRRRYYQFRPPGYLGAVATTA